MGRPVALELSRQAVGLTLANRQPDAQAAVAAVSRALADGTGGVLGRQAVDVAFNLALAGAADSPALDTLANMAEDELRTYRWRRRGWGKPRSAYTLVQLAERAAASGLRAPLGLYDILGEILSESDEFPHVASELQHDRMWLGSERAAAWLYRAARRQTKLTASDAQFLDTETLLRAPPGGSLAGAGQLRHVDPWFEDSRAPLVVDLGCGYGVGALTAAAGAQDAGAAGSAFARPNYLSCDLSPQGIGYARGVARRWAVGGRAAFLQSDAATVLRAVAGRYDGPVAAVVLCCPSPYQASLGAGPELDPGGADRAGGNSQLPRSASSDAFLGNAAVLAEAARLLAPGGRLLLSSNAEDVAVTMAAAARELGLEIVHELESGMTQRGTAAELSRRSTRWREQGGSRAEGPGWRRGAGWALQGGSPWPDAAAALGRPAWSETELAHRVDGAAVHRIVLQKVGG